MFRLCLRWARSGLECAVWGLGVESMATADEEHV